MGLDGTKCGLPHMVMSGNQAIALGALKAGMTFYSGYPMTPASPLLHWFATMEEIATHIRSCMADGSYSPAVEDVPAYAEPLQPATFRMPRS